MAPAPFKGFPSLLYYHLIHSGKFEIAKVAPALEITPSALYKYCEADSTFPPDLLGKLFNATQVQEFLDFCVKDTNRTIAPRAAAAETRRTIEQETLDVAAAVGELAQHIAEAAADGISEIEARRIENIVSKLHSEIEQVRMKVREKGDSPQSADGRREGGQSPVRAQR